MSSYSTKAWRRNNDDQERSLLGQFFFGGNPSRVERVEKILRYVIHRIDEEGALHEVLEKPYVRRNYSQDEIDEIRRNAELVHACREHLEQTFRSGELDPRPHRTPSRTHSK